MKTPSPINSVALIFLFVITFLISCKDSSNNIQHHHSDYSLYKLQGNVKSMLLSIYNNNDSLIESDYFFFNSKGQTVERKFKALEISVVHQYQYDSKGKKLRFKRIEDGEVVTDDKSIDSLDAEKRLVRSMRYDLNDQLSTETNYYHLTKGNLTTMVSFSVGSSGISIDSFFHDSSNQLIKRRYISFNTDSVQTRDIITCYNSMGKKISDIAYLGKDEFDAKEILTYDSLGNLVTSMTYLSEQDSNYYERSHINYNSKGLKTDSTYQFCSASFSEKDNEWTKKCRANILKYNAQGKIQHLIIKQKGAIVAKTTFYYNEEGNLTRKEVAYEEGFTSVYFDKMGYEISSKYWDKNKVFLYEDQNKIEYDAKNNLLEAKLLKKGKLERVIKRTYEYY